MIITLTTDFGAGSRYVAQMKGVLLSRAPRATLVDLSHNVRPQDIRAASRLLQESVDCFPEETVHLAVVDPGVGTEREIAVVRAHDQWFVGPDNGLFGWTMDNDPKAEAVALDVSKIDPAGLSSTFHGRDLMAPAAAMLAQGAALADLGSEPLDLVRLPPEPLPTVEHGDGRSVIRGRIAEIDAYGNLITNIDETLLNETPHGDALRIVCGEHETFGVWRTYAEQPPQTLIALFGSTNKLELAIVNGNAAKMLGAVEGETVTLEWGTGE